MQADPLISVIIPIYKVEDYLKRCVDSIIEQTYQNLEIILVNDGSPDNCPAICDEYGLKDNRILAIHQKNAGLAEARNSGLDIAKGEFISFVDSDDAVHPQFIESLYKGIVQTNSDLAICGFQVFSKEDEINTAFSNVEVSSSIGAEILNSAYQLENIVAWNKLYKRQIWQHLRYPKGKYHEDEFVFHLVFHTVNKACKITAPLYYYFRRENSIMSSKGAEFLSKRKTDLLEAEDARLKFSEANQLDTLYKVTHKRKMRTLYFICEHIPYHLIADHVKEEVKRNFRDFTKKQRVKILLRRFFPALVSVYKKMKSVSTPQVAEPS